MQHNTPTGDALPPRKRKRQSRLRVIERPEPGGAVVIQFGRRLTVPDVAGLTLREAALAYAEAGWFVLPVQPGQKSPGSVVGGRWQDQSSRARPQIERWWDDNPKYGIALHAGRSGAVIFDLDNAALDELPKDLSDGLRQGVCQLSRRDNPDRGHYLFLNDGGYGNGAGAFAPFGDVRGKNGVIIATPTPHTKDDGHYRWTSTGEVSQLPDALRACLSQASGREAPPLTDQQFTAFCSEHTRNERPAALDGVLAAFEKEVCDGGSSHEALVRALPWAFREVCAGCYPAFDVVQRMQETFTDSFGWEGRNPDGRTRPGPNEFVRTAVWAAAQAQLADPEETRARLDRDDPANAEVDEEAFWGARPELTQLRDFARSRRVGPWSMFGVVLARAVAAIPPSVVLPPLVGDHASLNLFVAIAAKSGSGKGSSEAAAEAAVQTDPDVHTATPGSGEGILKEYAYKAKQKQVDVRNSVLFSVPEIDSLAALKGRNGATLMPELRKAWMGEQLGFSYAADDKKFAIKKHRFRMTMVVGVQPGRSQTLFEDADGGTPQRFLWFPATDPQRPATRPANPGTLKLDRWPTGVIVTDGRAVQTTATPGEGEEVLVSFDLQELRLAQRANPDDFHVLGVPDSAVQAVDSEIAAKLDGDDTNDLDSHGQLMRLKVAAALMWLNGRTDAITEDDWALAGTVKAVSDRTRALAQGVLRVNSERASVARGKAEGRRELAKAEVVEEDRLNRAVKLVRRHVQQAEHMSRRDGMKKLRPELRSYYDEAVDRLVDAGVIKRQDGDQGSYEVVFMAAD